MTVTTPGGSAGRAQNVRLSEACTALALPEGGDVALAFLSHPSACNRLRELDLSGSRIGAVAGGPAAVAAAIGPRGMCPSLRALRLASCELGDAGAAAVAGGLASGAAAGRGMALSWLDLGSNGIGDEGAAALARALHLLSTTEGGGWSVVELRVDRNPIGERGARALAGALGAALESKFRALSFAELLPAAPRTNRSAGTMLKGFGDGQGSWLSEGRSSEGGSVAATAVGWSVELLREIYLHHLEAHRQTLSQTSTYCGGVSPTAGG